jgi:signal transduction histidine kinase
MHSPPSNKKSSARSGRVVDHGSREQLEAVGTGDALSYAAVVQAMDLGYCRVEVLEPVEGALLDWRVLDLNPAFEAEMGVSGLLGRRASEIGTGNQALWEGYFKAVLVSGQALHATVGLPGSGATIRATILPPGGPGSRQLVVLLKNITAQTLATQRMQESEQAAHGVARRAEEDSRRLAAVLEATPASVVVVNRNYEAILMNNAARELRGNSPSAGPMAMTARWADGSERQGQLLEPADWPLHRALRGESSREVIEFSSPTDGRSLGIFLTSAAPIRGQDMSIEGALTVSTNITDRVMAERALQKANDLKDRFLAMLAHELRNPLAPIVAAAELISRFDTPVEQMRQSSAIITRQAQHMRGLVDDLLDASRVSHGIIEIERHLLDLHELVHEAIEQSQPLLQDKGHEIRLKLCAGALLLQGDAKRIVQILTNLLNNAARYTPAGGWVRVSTQVQAGWVEVEVADSGIGMSADTLTSAFDLFSQAERSVDRQLGGLGIGLALVRKLVHLHGGQVQAASDGLGCGSRFTVRLPLYSGPESVALSSTGTLRAGTSAQPLAPQMPKAARVLVVDDNVDAANTLAMVLRASGHECVVAHEAEQALALAAQSSPQVFILDIGLPGMNGHELAQHLRRDPATRQARILALSGYAQTQVQEQAKAAGFDHYLVKPVNLDQLLQLL